MGVDGIVGGGVVLHVADDYFVEGLHDMQCGELLVQNVNEVILEGDWIECEGLEHLFVDAGSKAHGCVDRVGEHLIATPLTGAFEALYGIRVLELFIITFLDGVEARSTGKDCLCDGRASQATVELVYGTCLELDVLHLLAEAEPVELLDAIQRLIRRVDSTICGAHDRRQAVGEHGHENARVARDYHDQGTRLLGDLVYEATYADLVLPLLPLLPLLLNGLRPGLGLLDITDVHGALRHLLASGYGRICFLTTGEHMCIT